MALNGMTSKIIIGAIISTAICITGTGIVYNRNDAIKEFKEIRQEYQAGDKEVLGEVKEVKELVADLRLEQRDLAIYIKQKL